MLLLLGVETMDTFIEAVELVNEIKACNPRLFAIPETKAIAMQAPGLPCFWVRVTFPLCTERDFYTRSAWVDYTQKSGDIYKPGLLQYNHALPVVDEHKQTYGLHIHTYFGSFIVSEDSPFAQQYSWLDSIEANSPEEAVLRFSAKSDVVLTLERDGVWKASNDLHSAPTRDAMVAESERAKPRVKKATPTQQLTLKLGA